MTARPTTAPRALLPAAGLTLALLVPAGPALAVTTATGEPAGPCPDATGVTVVVDMTDLGGEVEMGCASDAATGTEALQAAGFTDTRDASGLICAIDAAPDPCPTEFTGSYWSYWNAEPGGEWTSYMVGSDEAAPAPGTVEGWRYSDGAAGPTVAPPVPGEPVAGAEPSEEPTAEPAEESATEEPAEEAGEPEATAVEDDSAMAESAAPQDGDDGGTSPLLVVGIGLLVGLAIAAVMLVRRRPTLGRGNGPAGQD